MKNFTKKDQNEMIDITKERIIERFKSEYGFAPCKKEIIPLEYGSMYMEEYKMWIITDMAFSVGNKGYVITNTGDVERNDYYDL